jgi:hypothetical protein
MNAGTGFLIIISLFNLAAMVVFYLLMKSRFSTRKILSEIRSEVDKLVSDLGREADRDVALLESRIKNLRALMDEADRRIILAGREEAKRKAADSLIAEIAPVQAVQAERPEARPAETQSTGSSSRQDSALPRELELFPSDPIPVPAPEKVAAAKPASDAVRVYSRPVIKRSGTPIEPVIPVREKVIDLSMKGFSAEMIAHTLSISLGEVELILDMNDSSL